MVRRTAGSRPAFFHMAFNFIPQLCFSSVFSSDCGIASLSASLSIPRGDEGSGARDSSFLISSAISVGLEVIGNYGDVIKRRE